MIALGLACLTAGCACGYLLGLFDAARRYHDVIGDPIDWWRRQDTQADLIVEALLRERRGDVRRKLRAVR